MTIDADSRILFFAPHPDDETLAGGGLLQKAAAAGAMVHVVFATSGDNNPWPHRLLERRWTIGPLDRALWGKRRAQEAINALATLGIPSSCSQFLQLPDQRLTELLLHANADAVAKIRSAIEQTRPRLVFAPSLFDLHPDHSALHILVRRAMADAEANETQLLCYCVHEPPEVPARPQIGINLSPAQQQRKRRAILCHRTQMALSRRRFLAHARCSEFFWPAATGRYGPETHPVRTVELAGDILV
ncbi:MAG: PIG-L family deacetylase, partial [Verrucomicrobia bacterium]|nr:PIG-L family deacetylase [Verrucomicrobiota bacterium]